MTEPTRNKLSVAAIFGFLVCGCLLLTSAFAAAHHASANAVSRQTNQSDR